MQLLVFRYYGNIKKKNIKKRKRTKYRNSNEKKNKIIQLHLTLWVLFPTDS